MAQYKCDFKLGDPAEIFCRLVEDKGAAQKKEPANGKA
jgi:hypothetical protein